MRREKLEKLKQRTIDILNTEVFSFKEAYWVISTGAKFIQKTSVNLIKNTRNNFVKNKKLKTPKAKIQTPKQKAKKTSIRLPFKKFFKTEIQWNYLEFKELDVFFNKLKKNKPSLKKLGKPAVSIKNQNCLHPDYIITTNINDFNQMLAWREYLPGFSTIARLYDTGLYHQFNIQEQEATITSAKITTLDKNTVSINKHLNVFEEFVKIKTLTKETNLNELYRFPVQLTPCGIGFFSTTQLEEFKLLLANSQKTRPYNVEIVNVYDNFNIELYLKIMQSPNTNKFNCFLSPEKHNFNKFRQFYLVVGKRKDNNASITALYPKT